MSKPASEVSPASVRSEADALAARLRGPLLRRGSPGCEEARSVWNGMIDRRPAPVAHCAGAPEFLAGLAKVRQISDTRTAEQDALANFCAFPTGAFARAGYGIDQAAQLVVARHLRDRDAAHLIALMSMVGFDAIIATHDAKYAYRSISGTTMRPESG